MLSNFDLVTESLTLIAGNSSLPAFIICCRRLTPVVVSSVTPRMPSAMRVKRSGSSAIEEAIRARKTFSSSEEPEAGSGAVPAASNSTPLWISSVGSPPSSSSMLGPSSPGQRSVWSIAHQNSSRVSPFQAKVGMPALATAAAAWSWVEKMLQEAQRSSAPEGDQGLHQHRGLHRHVEGAGDAGAGQRLLGLVLRAQRHQARHLVLGQVDVAAAVLGQAGIGDLEVVLGCGGGAGRRHRLASSPSSRR